MKDLDDLDDIDFDAERVNKFVLDDVVAGMVVSDVRTLLLYALEDCASDEERATQILSILQP